MGFCLPSDSFCAVSLQKLPLREKLKAEGRKKGGNKDGDQKDSLLKKSSLELLHVCAHLFLFVKISLLPRSNEHVLLREASTSLQEHTHTHTLMLNYHSELRCVVKMFGAPQLDSNSVFVQKQLDPCHCQQTCSNNSFSSSHSQ